MSGEGKKKGRDDPSEEISRNVLSPQIQMPPEIEHLQEQMINLIFETASCQCPERDQCGVFHQAQMLATTMKKLQDSSRRRRK